MRAWLNNGSRVSREAHARFCERLRGKFLWSTYPVTRRRGDGASAPFHYALASRFTRSAWPLNRGSKDFPFVSSRDLHAVLLIVRQEGQTASL